MEDNTTAPTTQLIVVSSDVLPEVFLKVLEVKRCLARGEYKSSASCCKAVGISRSTFYKYKDCVFAYDEKMTQKIISVYAVLRDEPGVLSGLISALHSINANILTVNQNIPSDGAATVTVSLRLGPDSIDALSVKKMLSKLFGVVDVKLISGE